MIGKGKLTESFLLKSFLSVGNSTKGINLYERRGLYLNPLIALRILPSPHEFEFSGSNPSFSFLFLPWQLEFTTQL